MKRMLKMMTAVLALGGLMAIGGCGSDEANPLPPLQPKDTPVTIDPTKTTPTSVTTSSTTPTIATSVTGATIVTIPTNTVISVPAGSTMPANPVVEVAVPTNGGVGYVPTPAGTTLTLGGSAGAVSISIPGTTTFSVSNPATVVIPVINTTGLVDGATNVPVTMIKPNGTTDSTLLGTYSAAAKTVTVTTSNFCFFLIKPVWLTPTGSTGSTGT